MEIGIFNEDLSIRNDLKSKIEAYFRAKKVFVHIVLFHRLGYLDKSRTDYDIIFADATEQNLALIRSAGHTTRFLTIFTASTSHYALLAFELNAVHYLVYPILSQHIREALDRCLTRMECTPACAFENPNTLPRDRLILPQHNCITTVLCSTIIYIDVFDKYSFIHTTRKNIKTRTALSALFAQLDKSIFIRPQRSFIVSMAYIETLFPEKILLFDDTEIVISRKLRNTVREQYLAYLVMTGRSEHEL